MLGVMAYTLEAFLARSPLAADVAAAVGSVAVPLDQGVALVPLPQGPEGNDADGLLRRVAGLSERGAVAYVEAEYFGGVGEQSTVLWLGGVRHEPETIKEALRALGVRAVGDRDEYDTVGLGRHRTTQDWVTSA